MLATHTTEHTLEMSDKQIIELPFSEKPWKVVLDGDVIYASNPEHPPIKFKHDGSRFLQTMILPKSGPSGVLVKFR